MAQKTGREAQRHKGTKGEAPRGEGEKERDHDHDQDQDYGAGNGLDARC